MDLIRKEYLSYYTTLARRVGKRLVSSMYVVIITVPVRKAHRVGLVGPIDGRTHHSGGFKTIGFSIKCSFIFAFTRITLVTKNMS